MTTFPEDALNDVVYGRHGRDGGKQYTVYEMDVLTRADMALRLNVALRIESFEDLITEWKAAADGEASPIDLIMGVLRGADPAIVRALIEEVLEYVRVSPDPQHPGVNRPLLADRSDIREIKTLGEILAASLKLNFGGI